MPAVCGRTAAGMVVSCVIAMLLRTVAFFNEEKGKVLFNPMFLDFRKSVDLNVLALAFYLSFLIF
jgi:hypothetical protein